MADFLFWSCQLAVEHRSNSKSQCCHDMQWSRSKVTTLMVAVKRAIGYVKKLSWPPKPQDARLSLVLRYGQFSLSYGAGMARTISKSLRMRRTLCAA